MEAGFRTPLVDFFRRGEVPADIRLLAARGILAPRAHEQLALLMLLVGDPDAGIASVAEATIMRIPPDTLSAFLARSDAPQEARDFFASRGVLPAAVPAADTEAPLIEDPGADAASQPEAGEGEERKGLTQRLSFMTVAERMKVAMQGSREERSVLVRDPAKLVAVAVLSSPKVTESEVESFAKMANVSEEVLRIIGTTRSWCKNYGVAASLARNPKTPLAISLTMLGRLVERDVKMIATDRNVPEPLRLAARKAMQAGESRRH
jgi:hypothetical protein